MSKKLKRVEKAYWEAVYQHVDPFRKKGDKPLEEFVTYCDKLCFEEIWAKLKKEIKKASKS